MTAKLIDGKKLANKIQLAVAANIQSSCAQGYPAPCLAVVLVGNNPASQIYISRKQKACEEVKILSRLFTLPENVLENDLISLIHQLNQDPKIHGILVQLPLPSHINSAHITPLISPQKDVDGFHSQFFPACTAMAIMEILDSLAINLTHKIAVVVGQSIIVGKPTALLLEAAGCKVIRCDRSTVNLAAEVKQADILVVAVGKPNLIPGEWIKLGAIVIDAGINHIEDGVGNKKIVGDIEFNGAAERASFITPVPGGVGPVTVAMLMKNTWLASRLS